MTDPDATTARSDAPPAPASAAGSAGPEPLDLPAGVHQLCGCGLSRHGWFCDGAHLGSGRVFYELRLEAPATVLLCRCRRSHRYPLCDGRHGTPSPRPWWRWWR
jgi:CDGSH-type Zn-finger protein